MKALALTPLSQLSKGLQFTCQGDAESVWEVTEPANHPKDVVQAMNLMTRRVFDDMPGTLEVYVRPRNRRININHTVQVGDRVQFTDMHHAITGKGVVKKITYPNGEPRYHIEDLTDVPLGFKTVFVCPNDYVGDRICQVK